MTQNDQTHFKNLAAFVARFLKYVWPFWDIMYRRVKKFMWEVEMIFQDSPLRRWPDYYTEHGITNWHDVNTHVYQLSKRDSRLQIILSFRLKVNEEYIIANSCHFFFTKVQYGLHFTFVRLGLAVSAIWFI